MEHYKADVDRLHIPINEGGIGLISIEDYVELAIRVWKCMLIEVRKD